MKFSQETLMAYADGELDEQTRREIEAEMAADPQVAREVVQAFAGAPVAQHAVDDLPFDFQHIGDAFKQVGDLAVGQCHRALRSSQINIQLYHSGERLCRFGRKSAASGILLTARNDDDERRIPVWQSRRSTVSLRTNSRSSWTARR